MRRGARSPAALAVVLLLAALVPGAMAAAADEVTFVGLSVTPQKAFTGSQGGVRIEFQPAGTGPADVVVRVLGAKGEVRRFTEPQVPAGTAKTVVWDGLDASGVPVADGAYRVTIGQAGGAEQQAGRVTLAGHYFPVRARHGSRGAVGRFHAPRSGGRIHEGFDILGACGSPLAAVRTGTVTRKGYDPVLYGNFIQIRGLGERQSYFYSHMVKPSPFDRGEKVPTAAIVGRIGQTGNAVGLPCHLHFQIMLGKTPIDPLPQLRRWDRQS